MTFIFSLGKVKVCPWCVCFNRYTWAINFGVGSIALVFHPYDTHVGMNRALAARDLGLPIEDQRRVFFTHADKVPRC